MHRKIIAKCMLTKMEQKVLLRHLFEQGLMMTNICSVMLSSVITEKNYDFSNAFNSGFETVIE
ncbi:MAG: hypothetical protein V7780_14575 [Colwellia sp.]